MSNQDEEKKAGLVVVFGVVAAVVAGVIWLAASGTFKHKAPPAPVAAAAVVEDVLVDLTPQGPALSVVYFAVGEAVLQADAEQALNDAVKALAADSGKRVLLSGYHDASGDPAKNAELAKERAKSVRAALVMRGVPQAQVLLRKPEQTLANGPAEEARRVEIRLVEVQ